jgi:hypothetical protein
MNVKSFQNDVNIAVNVDLDLVDVVGELPDGRTVLRFGDEWVTLAGSYAEIEPQVTAKSARRVPLPPPPPPAPPAEPPVPPAGLPPDDNANNGGGAAAAPAPENP